LIRECKVYGVGLNIIFNVSETQGLFTIFLKFIASVHLEYKENGDTVSSYLLTEIMNSLLKVVQKQSLNMKLNILK